MYVIVSQIENGELGIFGSNDILNYIDFLIEIYFKVIIPSQRIFAYIREALAKI